MKKELYKLSNLNGFYADFTNLQLRKDIKDVHFLWMCELQKWVREKYDIHINISKIYECNKFPALFKGWHIYIAGETFEINYKVNNELINKYFKTYEMALEKGLIEALKLIK